MSINKYHLYSIYKTAKLKIANIFILLFKVFKSKSTLVNNTLHINNNLRKNGYCYINNYYSHKEIDYLNSIFDSFAVKASKDENLQKILNFHKTENSFKIKHIQNVSKEVNRFSKDLTFVMASIFFNFFLRGNTFYYNFTEAKKKNLEANSFKQIAGDPHIDWPNKNVLKMIIFLDDVNEKNGPTAMVPNSNKNKKLFNYYSSVWSEPSLNEKENYLKNYLGPETFKEVVNEKTTKYLTGKKGDIVFIDSSNIHWASDLLEGQRKVCWVYF